MKGALQKWLEPRSRSSDVEVEAVESELDGHRRLPPPRRRASARRALRERAVSELVVTPNCSDDERRADLIAPPPAAPPPFADLNGIDFVEVDAADHRHPPRHVPQAGARRRMYGITPDRRSASRSTGGTRIVGIRPIAAARRDDRARCASTSTSPATSRPTCSRCPTHPDLDPCPAQHRSSRSWPACPTDVDCRQPMRLPAARARRAAARLPREGLRELPPAAARPAAAAQPATGPSATRPTSASRWSSCSPTRATTSPTSRTRSPTRRTSTRSRTRISARRHARLVDYRDARRPQRVDARARPGRRARGPSQLARGTPLFTQLVAPLPGQTVPPPDRRRRPGAITVDGARAATPRSRRCGRVRDGARVALHRDNNEIRIHTWGNEECCLAAGATEAYLYAVAGRPDRRRASRARSRRLPRASRRSWARARARPPTPTRRTARSSASRRSPTPTTRSTRDTLVADVLQLRRVGQPALPLLRVRWRRADALRFPLCLSGAARRRHARPQRLASRAATSCSPTTASRPSEEFAPDDARRSTAASSCSRGPLTMQMRPAPVSYDPDGRLLTDRTELDGDVRAVKPGRRAARDDAGRRRPVDGRCPTCSTARRSTGTSWPRSTTTAARVLRFGDGEYGARLGDVVALDAVYRVGNGRAGNIGAEALAHAAPVPGRRPGSCGVRNPLAASGGADPETIEEVRQLAPQAFRAEQFRAVTEADWAEAALRLPDVPGAVATFRWTAAGTRCSSPSTRATAPTSSTCPNGRTRLQPAFERRVRGVPHPLPARRLRPRAAPAALRAARASSSRCARRPATSAATSPTPSGARSPRRCCPTATRGFFHPANFTFGAARLPEPALRRGRARRGRRLGGRRALPALRASAAAGELETGVLPIGPWEIARLDNDPSFVEHGVLTVIGRGGKG